nr:MAG TPA: hypothetical protein [Caudoviricetes sp.]DAW39006.1 MAG TPA: hypothetical protein [Caudoviricetes sp.]
MRELCGSYDEILFPYIVLDMLTWYNLLYKSEVIVWKEKVV